MISDMISFVGSWWNSEEKQSVLIESDDYVIGLEATEINCEVTPYGNGVEETELIIEAENVDVMANEGDIEDE